MDRLTPETGMQYVCHFSLGQRASAIKLLRQNKHLSASNVLQALCFGRVVITAETMKQLQGETLKQCGEKRFLQAMNIKKLSTTQGVDPVRKRGVAQDYKRQLVVRTWPFKSLDHPGHAALSIKDMRSEDKSKHMHKYLSWWGSDYLVEGGSKWLRRFGLDALNRFSYRFGADAVDKDYKEDKKNQLSWRTVIRLIAGAGDQQYLDSDDRMEGEKSPLKPRPRQARLGQGVMWGMKADKVYLPSIGENSGNNTDKFFSYFGLNEHDLDRLTTVNLDEADQEEAVYGFYSSKDSCAGKMLQALKAGGAHWYVRLHDYVFFPNPNHVHKVAISLQQRIDALNTMTETLTAASKQWNDAQGDHPANCTSYAEELRAGITLLKNSPLKKQMKKLQKVITEFEPFESVDGGLAGYQPLDALSLDSFMPKAVKFVEGFHKAWHLAKTDAERQALQPAFGAFAFMKSTIERLHRLESSDA